MFSVYHHITASFESYRAVAPGFSISSLPHTLSLARAYFGVQVRKAPLFWVVCTCVTVSNNQVTGCKLHKSACPNLAEISLRACPTVALDSLSCVFVSVCARCSFRSCGHASGGLSGRRADELRSTSYAVLFFFFVFLNPVVSACWPLLGTPFEASWSMPKPLGAGEAGRVAVHLTS